MEANSADLGSIVSLMAQLFRFRDNEPLTNVHISLLLTDSLLLY